MEQAEVECLFHCKALPLPQHREAENIDQRAKVLHKVVLASLLSSRPVIYLDNSDLTKGWDCPAAAIHCIPQSIGRPRTCFDASHFPPHDWCVNIVPS